MFQGQLHTLVLRNSGADTQENAGDKTGKKFGFLINPSAVSNTPRGQVHCM